MTRPFPDGAAGRRAFSLVEVLIAGLLLSGVLSGLGLSARLYERSLLKNGNRLTARHFAQELLEDSFNLGYEGVDSMNGNSYQHQLVWRSGGPSGATQGGETTFTAQVTVIGVAPFDKLKNVVVEVSYPELNDVKKLRMGSAVFLSE